MTLMLPFAVACALAYMLLSPKPTSILRSVIKTLAVALLALVGVVEQGPVLIVVALAFCALGDWLLSRDGERVFLGGIVAFATGHLAYIALFLGHPLSNPARLTQRPQIWFIVGFIVLGLAMVRLVAPRAGALRGAVLAYIPVILGMGLAALTLPGQGALVWVLPAALAFVGSDVVLAIETFLLPENHPVLRVTPYVIWPLYWGAQVGFLVSFT